MTAAVGVGFSVLGEGDFDVDELIAAALCSPGTDSSVQRAQTFREARAFRDAEKRDPGIAAGSRFNPQPGHSG